MIYSNNGVTTNLCISCIYFKVLLKLSGYNVSNNLTTPTYSHMTRTGLFFFFWMAPTSPITFSREATRGGPAVVQPLMWYRTTFIGGLVSCIVCIQWRHNVTFHFILAWSLGHCKLHGLHCISSTCHPHLRTVKDIQQNLVAVLHGNSVTVVDLDKFAIQCSHPLIRPEREASFLPNAVNRKRKFALYLII